MLPPALFRCVAEEVLQHDICRRKIGDVTRSIGSTIAHTTLLAKDSTDCSGGRASRASCALASAQTRGSAQARASDTTAPPAPRSDYWLGAEKPLDRARLFAPGLIGICPDTCIASSQFRYELQTGRRSDYLATRSSRKANRNCVGTRLSQTRGASQTSWSAEVKCAAEGIGTVAARIKRAHAPIPGRPRRSQISV